MKRSDKEARHKTETKGSKSHGLLPPIPLDFATVVRALAASPPPPKPTPKRKKEK